MNAPPVPRSVQAAAAAVGAFLVAFAVVYTVGRLIAALVVVIAALAASGYAALVAYRYVTGLERSPLDPDER